MFASQAEQEASTGGSPVDFDEQADAAEVYLSEARSQGSNREFAVGGRQEPERSPPQAAVSDSSSSSSAAEDNPVAVASPDRVALRRHTEVRFATEVEEMQNENDCIHKIRNEIDDLVNRPSSSPYAQLFQRCIIGLILISTASVIIETVPEMRGQPIFLCIEVAVTVLFTAELLLRFAACKKPGEFFTNGFNLVDLFAILPGYMEMIRVSVAYKGAWTQDKQSNYAILSLRMIRLLWLVRIMRLAKVARHSRLLNACFAVFAKENTSVKSILTLILLLTTTSATLLYFVESDRCQTLGVDCEGFDSIPSACWFSITTLSTVGYGDRVPRTVAGKIIASLVSVGGVMIIALAGSMLSWDFAEHFKDERAKKRIDVGRRRPSLEMAGIQQALDIQDATQQFMDATDQLMARLILICSERDKEADEDEQLPCVAPFLKLLQERARLLRAEVSSYTITCVTELRSQTRNEVANLDPPIHDEDLSTQVPLLPTTAEASRESLGPGEDRMWPPASPKPYRPPTPQLPSREASDSRAV